MKWIESIPWLLLIAMSVTLGLAPFVPEPHLLEKTRMLVQGALIRPVDIFDFLMHGAGPVLLLLKSIYWVLQRKDT